jgi:hypothetical protein
VYWEDIPHRPNRCGQAWERYYQRMHRRNENQGERVVGSMLTHDRSENSDHLLGFNSCCVNMHAMGRSLHIHARNCVEGCGIC